jgi:hypothetical protein
LLLGVSVEGLSTVGLQPVEARRELVAAAFELGSNLDVTLHLGAP